MAYCPNCGAVLNPDAVVCNTCGATFGTSNGWRPLETLPKDFESRPTGTDADASARMLFGLLRWTAYGAISFSIALSAMLIAGHGGLNVWPGDVFFIAFVITWILLVAIWNSRWKNKILEFLSA